MIIVYLTTDEVNEGLALQMADECSITLYSLSPGDTLPGNRFDAVLLDWDALPWRRRQEILWEALAGPSCRPVAVHSYNLEQEEVETLHQDGIAVFPRLEPEVFRTLRRLAAPKARGLHVQPSRRHALAPSGH